MSPQNNKPRRPRQLALDFPDAGLSLGALSVTPANRTAIAVLKRWPDWRTHTVALTGQPKSGLTTAAHAWAEKAGGEVLGAHGFDQLSHKQIEFISTGATVVDLADAVSNEDNLLSLINLSNRLGGSVLLTGHTVPARWHVSQPDLASRLKSMTLVELGPPDDEMVSVRLRAAMKRRFLKLPDDVEAYLLTRIERNYAALELFVDSLHQMAEGREVTVPLAREVLDEQDGTWPLFEDGDH